MVKRQGGIMMCFLLKISFYIRANKELIPDNIDSYPELKNYYLNLYRQGLIEKDLPISPDEDPTIPDKVTLSQS